MHRSVEKTILSQTPTLLRIGLTNALLLRELSTAPINHQPTSLSQTPLSMKMSRHQQQSAHLLPPIQIQEIHTTILLLVLQLGQMMGVLLSVDLRSRSRLHQTMKPNILTKSVSERLIVEEKPTTKPLLSRSMTSTKLPSSLMQHFLSQKMLPTEPLQGHTQEVMSMRVAHLLTLSLLETMMEYLPSMQRQDKSPSQTIPISIMKPRLRTLSQYKFPMVHSPTQLLLRSRLSM